MKVALLEQEVAANHKIADLVLIEIKALFGKSLAKIQFLPEVTQLAPQQHLVPVKQYKTREVLIPTTRAGDGNSFQHPAKPEYQNPITGIYEKGDYHMKFATKDGVVSEHPGNTIELTLKQVQPLESTVAKIQVWHSDAIFGIKFFNKEGKAVLEAG